MNRLGFLIILILSSLPMTVHADAPTTAPQSDLRVIYYGHKGTPRQQDFAAFLGKHFKQAQSRDMKEFKEEQTREYDVILFDYDFNEWAGPVPSISDNYARPTVTIGVYGASLADRWRLKTGYL
jgi:hypothetical protein